MTKEKQPGYRLVIGDVGSRESSAAVEFVREQRLAIRLQLRDLREVQASQKSGEGATRAQVHRARGDDVCGAPAVFAGHIAHDHDQIRVDHLAILALQATRIVRMRKCND